MDVGSATMSVDTYFHGKVALVTGAASGIGKELASALVRRDATVVLADIDDVAAKAAADELAASAPGRAVGVGIDVRDAAGVADLVRRVAADHGRVDLLFNNAGIGMGGDAAELGLEHWRRVIDINLLGVLHGILAAYPVMIAQGSGHIVNTASLAGLVPSPFLTPYATTKHAVVGLSTSLRTEAAAKGVRVSVVCPGVIATPIWEKGNPADLPEVPSVQRALQRTERLLRRAYPPAALANDVLAGVARNRAIIVAPGHARLAWRLYRLAPQLVAGRIGALLGRVAGGGSAP